MEQDAFTPDWYLEYRTAAKYRRDAYRRNAASAIDAGDDHDFRHYLWLTVMAADTMSVCEQYDGHGDGSLESVAI